MRAAAERVAFLISERGWLSEEEPSRESERRSALAEMTQRRLLSAWVMTWFLVKVSAEVPESFGGRWVCRSRSRKNWDLAFSRAEETAL